MGAERQGARQTGVGRCAFEQAGEQLLSLAVAPADIPERPEGRGNPQAEDGVTGAVGVLDGGVEVVDLDGDALEPGGHRRAPESVEGVLGELGVELEVAVEGGVGFAGGHQLFHGELPHGVEQQETGLAQPEISGTHHE